MIKISMELVFAGAGAQIETTTANGRLVFGIFAAQAEFESELIRERTKASHQILWAFFLSKLEIRLACIFARIFVVPLFSLFMFLLLQKNQTY